MKCSRVRLFFDAMFREGDAFDYPDVAEHVKGCCRCSREYERWCSIARKLGDEPAMNAPPALYGKVMQEIEGLRGSTAVKWWSPLQWKVFPYGPLFAGLLLVAAVSFFIAMPRTVHRQAPVVSSGTPSVSPEVMVHFEISLSGARQVALVGDFNGWNVGMHLLTPTDSDIWKIDLPIAKGSYQYLFLVDGTQWKTDPGREQVVPDGFGGFNTVIEL